MENGRPELRSKFARRIRSLRRERGWTQEQLAEVAGFSSKYIGQLERKEVCPSLFSVNQLARAFELPLHDLVHFPESGARTRETIVDSVTHSDLRVVRAALGVLQRLFNGSGASNRTAGG